MIFTLAGLIFEWGWYGVKLYFGCKSSIKLITYVSKVRDDYSKTYDKKRLPMIMIENFF